MLRRTGILLLATATLSSALVVASTVDPIATPLVGPAPTAAAVGTANVIFDRPGTPALFGPNQVVEIYAGNISYVGGVVAVPGRRGPVPRCTALPDGSGVRSKAGVNDYIQPYADIYIVGNTPSPPVGELRDVAGQPNRVAGSIAGGFLFEPLTLTQPAGRLGAGTWALVIDECQNGVFDAGEDSYIPDAFRVDLQQNVPEFGVSAAAFTAMKASAARFSNGGRSIDELILQNELFKVAADLQSAATVTSPSGVVKFWGEKAAAAFGIQKPYDAYKQRGETVRNTAWAQYKARFLGIAKDPPQSFFSRPALPITAGAYGDQEASELDRTWAGYFAALDALSGVSGALLDAIERYQGADQAGDATWARRHARSIEELTALAGALEADYDAAEAALVAVLDGIQSDASARSYFNNFMSSLDLQATALLATDLATEPSLMNSGADVEVLASTLRTWERTVNSFNLANLPSEWVTVIERNGTDVRAFLDTLDGVGALAAATLPPLETELADVANDPSLAISVAGTPAAGAIVTLTASGAPAGASIAWDLDGDGLTDDATGATATWTVPGDAVAGAPLFVSAVTEGTVDETDVHDATTELVTVAPGGNVAPTIVSTSMSTPPTILPGATSTLTVTATDPNGDPLTYYWYVDGVEVAGADASTLVFTAGASTTESYFIQAWVSDGRAETRTSFFLLAETADTDGDGYAAGPQGPDCDDTTALVNPRRTEVVNGRDDDCDGLIDEPNPPGSVSMSLPTVVTEGQLITRTPAFNHPARLSGDRFEYRFDWGDGTVDTTVWSQPAFPAPTVPTPVARHQYEDDGLAIPWSVCVEWLDDPAILNEVNCWRRTIDVGNDRPLVNAADLSTWLDQSGPPTYLGSPPFIAPVYDGSTSPLDQQGRTVITDINTNAESAIVSPLPLGPDGYGYFAMTQDVLFDGDNDQLGVVLGYDPDDVVGGEFFDPAADFVGVSWWNPDAAYNPSGRDRCNDAPSSAVPTGLDPFTLWRRAGQPNDLEASFTLTLNHPYNPADDAGPPSEPVQDPKCSDADGFVRLGSVPTALNSDDFPAADRWEVRSIDGDQTPNAASFTPDPYFIEYDYRPDRIRVWVNGVLHLDVVNPDPIANPFPPGHAGVYHASQAGAEFSATAPTPTFPFVEGRGGEFDSIDANGDPILPDGISLPMHDGADDTHTIRVDWGDGSATTDGASAPDPARQGWFTITDTHVYDEAGTYTGRVCATDDEGLEGCFNFIAEVANSAPVVEAGPDIAVGATPALSDWTFRDPGPLDTHTATVDWDGPGPLPATAVDVTVDQQRGGGTIEATHTYTVAGPTTVELCVTDQHPTAPGNTHCDTRVLDVRLAPTAPVGSVFEDPAAATAEADETPVGIAWTDTNVDETYTVSVDWGDGSAPELVAVDQSVIGCEDLDPDPIDVAPSCNTAALAVPVHVYADNGTYEVTATITDSRGQSTDVSGDVVVENVAPTMTVTPPTVDGVTVSLAGTYTDPGTADTHRLVVDWGDGTTTNDPVTAGTFTATRTYAVKGSYPIEACVIDDDGGETCTDTLGQPDVPFIVSTEPARFADTRPTGETVDGDNQADGKLTAGQTVKIQITGRGPVPPTGVNAAVINIASVAPEARGFFTVYPCTPTRPNASALNFLDDNRANEIIAKLSPAGEICVYTSRRTHLLIDVAGYVPTGSDYVEIVPTRFADTRSTGETVDGDNQADGLLAPGQTVEVQITGRGTIPNTTPLESAVINIAAVQPATKGFFTVYPCTPTRPNASALNFLDDNRANEIITKLSPTGSVCIYTNQATHLLIDVVGYVPTGSDYTAVNPARFADTRASGDTIDGDNEATGMLPPGQTTRVQITGRGDIPAVSTGITAAVINIAAVAPTAQGFFTVYPCTPTRPIASALNYVDDNRANEIITKISANGEICIYNQSPTHLLVDVVGYISD